MRVTVAGFTRFGTQFIPMVDAHFKFGERGLRVRIDRCGQSGLASAGRKRWDGRRGIFPSTAGIIDRLFKWEWHFLQVTLFA